LNDYFNLMFQTPELIMMAIGASRIYRSLADYSSMTEFNWENERFWSLHGAATSNPPTIDGIQLSQPAVGDPQPSATILETFETASPTLTITKSVHKVESFSSSVVDLPV
jgi:hypothetical protein